MQSPRHYVLALGFVALATSADAQDTSRPVEIHGFGSWAYGRTRGNVFLDGTPQGDFRNVSMALNISKTVSDKLSIHTQGELREGEGDTETELDFAFAEYKLSDHLSFRVGQVKHPFGIYTEIFDVGTLRPFIDLPQGFYGPVGFVGESYKGVGLSGSKEVGSWNVAYDAYAGGNEIEKSAAPELFYLGTSRDFVPEAIERQSTRDVLGARVVLQTPIRGFTFGVSSYTGVLNEPASNRRTVVAGQVGYRSNQWTLESEVAHEDQARDEHAMGGYVLGAYRLSPEWQVAAQYDLLRNEFYGANTTRAPSLQDHREAAFALSRWMSRALVLKAEYHHVNGNRFSMPLPEDLEATVDAGELRGTTHLFKFGAQFTF
jgi:hypothetical protein